jgi:hypothetical protein
MSYTATAPVAEQEATPSKCTLIKMCEEIGTTRFCMAPIPVIRLFQDLEKAAMVSYIIYLQNAKPDGDYGHVAIFTAERARKDLCIKKNKYHRLKKELEALNLIRWERRMYGNKLCSFIYLNEELLVQMLAANPEAYYADQIGTAYEQPLDVSNPNAGQDATSEIQTSGRCNSGHPDVSKSNLEPPAMSENETSGRFKIKRPDVSKSNVRTFENATQRDTSKDQSLDTKLEKIPSTTSARARGSEQTTPHEEGEEIFSQTKKFQGAIEKLESQVSELKSEAESVKKKQFMAEHKNHDELQRLRDELYADRVELEERLQTQIDQLNQRLNEAAKMVKHQQMQPRGPGQTQLEVPERKSKTAQSQAEAKAPGHVKILQEHVDEFQPIWDVWPKDKRAQKDQCLQLFAQARANGVALETIKEGVRNYMQLYDTERMPKARAMFLKTFLRDQAWNDEFFARSIFDEAGVEAPFGWRTADGYYYTGNNTFGDPELTQATENYKEWSNKYSHKFRNYLDDNNIYDQHPAFKQWLYERCREIGDKRYARELEENPNAQPYTDEWIMQTPMRRAVFWACYFMGWPIIFVEPEHSLSLRPQDGEASVNQWLESKHKKQVSP